jgi:uncharacterized membrane protein
MPYCTNCGNEVIPNAAFCAHCGLAQPGAPRSAASAPIGGPFDSITPRTACILCYIPIFGVIPAIIALASQRFRTNARVRFDAFQSVYLFVAWLIVSTARGFPFGGLEHGMLDLMKLAFFICWIVLLVKASQGEQLRIPVIGDLAARSTTEQF